MKDKINKTIANRETLYPLTIVILWIILVLILPWKGFFFLNDDHVYEWNVRNFRTREFNFHAYTGPSTIFQTVLGSVVYSLAEDPSLLRLTTSLFFLLGVVYFFKILLLDKIKPKVSFFLSLVLMFNPIYLYLGFTFMSDTYFLSTMIISVYYFILSNRKCEMKNRILSMLFLSFSLFSRQQALFIIPAFIFTDLLWSKGKRLTYLTYLIPFTVILLLEFIIPKTTAYTEGSITKTLNLLFDKNTYLLAVERLVMSFYYIGFFSLPATFPFFTKKLKDREIFKRKSFLTLSLTFVFLLLASSILWVVKKKVMFYLPNILTYAGFFPSSVLMGIKQTVFVNSPLIVQTVITLISIFSFSIFVTLIFDNSSELKKIKDYLKNHTSFTIFLLTSILTLATLLIFRSYYDRYLLILLPALLVFLGISSRSYEDHLSIGFIIIALFLIVSVSFEQDYLILNRTVWEVPGRIGIDKMFYRGSIEFNAYQRLDSIKDSKSMEDFKEESWLPRDNEYEYYISYIPLPGFCVVREINYKSLISPGFKGSLVLLEKGCVDNNFSGE